VSDRYPFLISIPHGGLCVPPEVHGRINLSRQEILFNSDPHTRRIYGFDGRVAALVDFDVSRIFVDTNRPPYDYPPRAQDGVVKVITQDGTPIYRKGRTPDMEVIGSLLQNYYYPFHERLAGALNTDSIEIAFDCHSMLPHSPPVRMDAGRPRPLFCLSNRGDRNGKPQKPGSLVTCPPVWLQALARSFQAEFDGEGRVVMNDPFRGGFITVAHYRQRRTPWVQVEINRGLYEAEGREVDEARLADLRERIFSAVAGFWDEISR
jgi:N-formylglutamate amidohydrolase